MTSGEEQDNNIRWVYDFISRPIETATSYDVKCFSTKKWNVLNFDRKHFFALSNIEYVEDKQFYYSERDINSESIKYIKSIIKNDIILVGYELSEQTRKILDKIKAIYIDIWLHPIRYMDDVLFGLKSNNEEINNKLYTFNIPSETYYLYADRLKVQNYRGYRKTQSYLKDNSALFVGQTLNDKAVFHNGKMLNLLDFKNVFEKVVKKYNHVYYSRHPFVKGGDEEIINYLKKFKNVTLNDDPTYHLLASKEIEYVFSISSSVVHEAKYFSKDVEFLYKPVITIGDHKKDYTSVMHEIFYGHFWASILSPLMNVNNVPVVSYFSGKDKTRDALSFYWGYRNIDKVESVKQTVSTLWNKTRETNTAKNPQPKNKRIKLGLFDIIKEKKIISFDIFDTLITRKFYSPRDLFNLVENEYNKNNDSNLKEFKQFRILAENKALEKAIKNGKQECTLDEIYNCLKEILFLTDKECSCLKNIEIEQEIKNIIPRRRGIDIFEYAKKLDKKIILTSDMYLRSDVIDVILQKNKITGYDKIYISSEIGLKKKTGDLFKYVINDNKVSNSEILHIGDNIEGDVQVPSGMGIKTYHIPRAIDIAKFYTPEMKSWVDTVSLNKTPLLDAVVTTISNRYYDDESQEKSSDYGADKFKFGYQAFGPVIIGFTSWIKKTAIENNIKKLYFLSRDTKVAYDCFNILYPSINIESHYIYSSRRSVSIPLLKSKKDLLVEVYKTIYSTTISAWLENRFGITKDQYSVEILQKYSLKDYDHPIGGKFSKEKLSQLVCDLSDIILKNARKERMNLIDYLSSHGMDTNENIAVIDIGYAASMQSAYQKILNKENIHGIYYATFNSALKNITDSSLLHGYSVHLENPSSPKYGICSHRFFYETIFCDADNSFIKPIKTNNGFEIVKSKFDDSARQTVVKEIHSGVLALAHDLAENYSRSVLNGYIDPSLGSFLFDSFLKRPNKNDAEMFKGVLFEDATGPNIRRYLFVPDEYKNDKKTIDSMIWKEAASLFINPTPSQDVQIKLAPLTKSIGNTTSTKQNKNDKVKTKPLECKQNRVAIIERAVFGLFLKNKKKNKYINNREMFFRDSKNKFVLYYYNILGSKI